MITNLALDYGVHQPIKSVDYTEEEKSVWKYCFKELKNMFKRNACQEFNWTIN
jgi:phenylalanine-4-hydroxylase